MHGVRLVGLDGKVLGAMTVGDFIDTMVPAGRREGLRRDHVPRTDTEDPLPVAIGDQLGHWHDDHVVVPALPAPVVLQVSGTELRGVGTLQLPAVGDDH